MASYISVARIVKIRGIRGEVSAEILTDFPQRFALLEVVRLQGPVGTFTETIEKYWFHGERVILKFRGRDRPHQVQSLVGCEVQVPEEQAYPLPEDTYYDDDLIGCRVFEGDRELGSVSGIFKVSQEVTNLVVWDSRGQEFMIPLVREIVTGIDIEGSRIEVKLPPGLIDMTAVPAKRPGS